jgi:hypothetical protein
VPLRLGLVAVLSALSLAGAFPAAGRVDASDVGAYGGLGTWIDLYSAGFRADPNAIAASLARRGVTSLFVETGNFRQSADLFHPQQLSRLIEAAHARDIAVVAWYVPSLTNPARDLRRAVAAIRFTSAGGDRFDSFALDIESSAVANAAERTRRLLALSARLRAAVGPDYALGAIIPSPVGMKLLPRYWPHFPYAALARTYDVFLPMAYFSYRAHGSAAIARYVRTSVAIIRAQTLDSGLPIHVIGGLANATTTTAATAFLRAVGACGVEGFSLYDYFATRASVWPLLKRAAAAAVAARPAANC